MWIMKANRLILFSIFVLTSPIFVVCQFWQHEYQKTSEWREQIHLRAIETHRILASLTTHGLMNGRYPMKVSQPLDERQREVLKELQEESFKLIDLSKPSWWHWLHPCKMPQILENRMANVCRRAKSSLIYSFELNYCLVFNRNSKMSVARNPLRLGTRCCLPY
ncbi:uncharacterized protein LOC141856821 [Brevipalpus obovatus]|uniref:uncharacterized protein LOC141856821 n=1 Tax=Brevipalpus obovatus TaxID=246614 RepID=UPI003D9F35F0